MTKKQIAQDVLDTVDATPVALSAEQEQREHAEYLRRRALDAAIEHHKINGGMLTPNQLIEIAKYFHAYITGEVK